MLKEPIAHKGVWFIFWRRRGQLVEIELHFEATVALAFLQAHPDALNRVRSPLPSPSLSALSGMGKVKEKEEEELTIMGMLLECN